MGRFSRVILTTVFLGFAAGCGGATGGEAGVSTPVGTNSAGGDSGNAVVRDIQHLDFQSSSATVSFDSSSDDYLLVVNSTQQTGSDLSVQLARSTGAALTVEPAALVSDTFEDQPQRGVEGEAPSGFAGGGGDASPYEDQPTQFHNYLREMESVMRESGDFSEVPERSSQAALGAALKVGDSQSFRILSTMNSITTFKEVPATLRVVTNDLTLYVDDSSGGDPVSDADLETLARYFGDIALPKERALFGRESDINVDGRITIVMSCVVNGMATSGGIVTGFFFPGDLYQRSSVNPASNAQEIFYVLKPDLQGSCGTPISTSFAVGNILPGVLAHEYQHMTSFNQHVFKNRGPTEEPWLNECLSHFTEDLTGFNHENPSRVKLFLSQTAKTPIVSVSSPTLAERGACYTFLRYLYEQSPNGDAFISNLYQSSLTGVANLQAAYNSNDPDFDEFPEFISRWSIALSLSETGMTSDPKYNYRERVLNPETSSYTGICIRCDAQDGRGTVLNGPALTTVTTYPSTTPLKGTASQFYRLKAPTGSIRLSAPAGSEMAGAVIRLAKN